MIALILSIGFSVDFVAHVALAYTEVPKDMVHSPTERAVAAIR